MPLAIDAVDDSTLLVTAPTPADAEYLRWVLDGASEGIDRGDPLHAALIGAALATAYVHLDFDSTEGIPQPAQPSA